MVYASYANGFKAGGFVGNPNNATGNVTASPNAIDFNPEHVDAYEAGLKSQWFDNRVLVDLALFRSNYRSLQVAQNQPTTAGTLAMRRATATAVVSASGAVFSARTISHSFITLAGLKKCIPNTSCGRLVTAAIWSMLR